MSVDFVLRMVRPLLREMNLVRQLLKKVMGKDLCPVPEFDLDL